MKKLRFAILIAAASIPALAQDAAKPTGTSLGINILNGTLEADQFPGADMCAKIAAAIAALPPGGGNIDATHFAGPQSCATDFTATTKPAHIAFGQVLIQTTVPFFPGNQMLSLDGSGPQFTGIDYTSTKAIPAIITYAPANPSVDEFDGVHVGGMRIYASTASTVTDALLIKGVHRSRFENLSFWGITGCGFHSEYAVTDTFYRIHTSGADAAQFGMNAGSAPAHNLCWDELNASSLTTDGTAVDPISEGLTGAGIYVPAATTMVTTAGTSESNVGGIEVGSSSQDNTFIDQDMENNSSYDVQDAGTDDLYLSPLSSSLMHFTGGKYSRVLGGDINALTIDAGVSGFSYSTGAGGNSGVVTDNGTATNNLLQPMGFGQTPRGLIGPASEVGAGIQVDSNQVIYGGYYWPASSTVTFTPAMPVTTGQPWKVILEGTAENNNDGGGTQAPEIVEVTSTAPVATFGSATLTFGVNSSGYLQATSNSGQGLVFDGSIKFFPLNTFARAGTHAASYVGDVNSEIGFSVAGTPGFTGTKTAGSCVLTIAGGIITGVRGC